MLRTGAVGTILLAGLWGCSSSPKPLAQPPEPGKGAEPTQTKTTWKGSDIIQLAGANFAISNDYTLALPLQDGVALIQLPVEDVSVYLEAYPYRFGAKNVQDVAFSPDDRWAAVLEVGSGGPSRIFILSRGSGKDFVGPGLYGICRMWADSWDLQFSDDSRFVRASTYGYEDTQDTFDVVSCQKSESKGIGTSQGFGKPVRSPDGTISAERSTDKKRILLTMGAHKKELNTPDGAIISQDFHFLTNDVIASFTSTNVPFKELCLWSVSSGKVEAWVSFSDREGAVIMLSDKTVFRYNKLDEVSESELKRLQRVFRALFKPASVSEVR